MPKDPAFLFYDADAARDVSHMNRLERGAYFDFIQAQKKFGRMKPELIKKVLGSDFDSCWQNLEISLACTDGCYYIPWLEESISKRKAYCESRCKNRRKAPPRPKRENPDMPVLFPALGGGGAKYTMSDLSAYFLSAPVKKEQMAMLYKLTPGKLEELIARFCLKENEYANRKEALSHFLYWLDQQLKIKNNNPKTLIEKWME